MKIKRQALLFVMLVCACVMGTGMRCHAADTYGPKENVYVIGHCFLGGPTVGYPIDENGNWNEDFYTPATFTVDYSGADASGDDTPASIPTVHVGHWGHSSGRDAWESAFGMEDTSELPDIYKSDYLIDDPEDEYYGQINGGIDSDVYWALFRDCTFTNVNIEMHFPCAFYGCTFNNCSLDSRGGHDVVCYDCTFTGGHTNAYGVDGGVVYTYTSRDKADAGGVSAIHLSKCTVCNDDRYSITGYMGNVVNSFLYAYDARVYLYEGNVFKNLYNRGGEEISVILSDGAGYGLGGVYVNGGTYDNADRNGGAGDGIFIENRGASVFLNGGDISCYRYGVSSDGGKVCHGSRETGTASDIRDSAEANIYVKNASLYAHAESDDNAKNRSAERKTAYGIYAVGSVVNSDMSYSGFSVAAIHAEGDSRVTISHGLIDDVPTGADAMLSSVSVLNDSRIMADDRGICAVNSSVTLGDDAYIEANDTGIASGFSDITLSGGTIAGAAVGIDAANSVVAMTGGLIRASGGADSVGIRNSDSTLTMSGGCITDAKVGIYQDGVLRLSGDCSFSYDEDSVSIYLCRDRHIDVVSYLESVPDGIRIDTAVGDRALGRLIARCYDDDPAINAAVAEMFVAAFDNTDAVHASDTHSGEPVAAAIRAGTGGQSGLPSDEIVISGIFYAEYDANSGMSRITTATPIDAEEFYYREPHTFTTGDGNIPVPYSNGTDIGKSFIFRGWALRGDEISDAHIYREDASLTMDDDFKFYGIWRYSFDLYVSGNGQTEGEDYSISDISCDTVLPAGNTDPTGSYGDHFKKITEEDGYTVKNKWMGWSFRKDTSGGEADIPGSTDTAYTLRSLLGYESFEDILGMQDEGMAVIEDGRLSVTLYSVWNEYPRIKGYDIYITESEVGDLGEERIRERAEATDKEDGRIDNENIRVRDLDPDGFKHLGERGGASVILTVQDSCGNESACVVMIYILKDTPITSREGGDEAAYVRFIDRANYNKDTRDEGGNERFSVWRLCEDYRDRLLSSFDDLESESFDETYVFDADDMKEMSAYTASNKDNWLKEYFWSEVYNRFCAPNRK